MVTNLLGLMVMACVWYVAMLDTVKINVVPGSLDKGYLVSINCLTTEGSYKQDPVTVKNRRKLTSFCWQYCTGIRATFLTLQKIWAYFLQIMVRAYGGISARNYFPGIVSSSSNLNKIKISTKPLIVDTALTSTNQKWTQFFGIFLE